MICLLVAGSAASALAQSWSSAYESGLKAARANDWAGARKAFQQAAAYRPEDVSAATVLPGPPTEQRRWRNGASYSPNFLAAYAQIRIAATTTDATEQTKGYNTAAGELETLLAKSQYSKETFYYLHDIYVKTGNTEKRIALETKQAQIGDKANWKVDTETVDPEDVAKITGTPTKGTPAVSPGLKNGEIPAGDPKISNPAGTNGVSLSNGATGAVATIANKYALIIGNSESRLAGGAVPFAADDSQKLRESLMTNAGYLEANVDLVANATAAQIMMSAKALADRVPEGGTVFLYFTGAGVNVAGKDYLAGVDTEIGTDTSSMVPKAEMYKLFMSRGARLFAFFQVNRPIVDGNFFGKEVPLVGAISQMQSTSPGASIYSYTRNGKEIGIFTDSVVSVLADLRSNKVPIMEFGWQVFNKIKRGGTGSEPGGSRQVPTLPFLTNIAGNARF